jgi:carboxypeptidase Taq
MTASPLTAPPGAAYERLADRFRRIATIAECASMLNWDAATMMPRGGGPARGDQLAVLAGLAHGQLVAPEMGDDLAEAEIRPPDNAWQAANLRLMRHAYLRATALPGALVEASARACSACEKIWREARPAADFARVRPHLAEVVRLTRETAAALSEAVGLTPYDALMDGFQRGVRAADLDPVFADYEAFLRRALPEAEARQAAHPAPLRPTGPFPLAIQDAVCRDLAARLGLDFEHARLDRSAHPFSGGIPSDVRITTRYIEDDFTQAVLAVVHETGHALYERGLPAEWARQPVGEAAGMAAHESQSLIVEMQACRSDAFLSWLGGTLHAAFGGDRAPYAAENLARLWRRVTPGFIRVDADEMT